MSEDDRLRGEWHTRNGEHWPCQSKHAELLPLFNAGIAGAYAAAAKHRYAGKLDDVFACECGYILLGDYRDGKKLAIQNWREHILALTPADARPAELPLQLVYRLGQGRHDARTIAGMGSCREASGFESCTDPLCVEARNNGKNPGQPLPKRFEMAADVYTCTFKCNEHVFLGEVRIPVDAGFKPGDRVRLVIEEVHEKSQ